MAGGTSSSAPIVAGILSLLNGERLAEKLPPLGFVNPFLYMIGEDYPAALNDIVAGNNSGGNRLLEHKILICSKDSLGKLFLAFVPRFRIQCSIMIDSSLAIDFHRNLYGPG